MHASNKIDVDFGEVEAGATALRLLEIVNGSCTEQVYEAQRDVTTNPLDHVFELCRYSWTLSPDQVYKCKIYYRPFVPFSVNVDYFKIVNSAGVCANITKPIIIELYGYCGPTLLKADIQNRFTYPRGLKSGFEGYMSDTIIIAQDLPATSLSKGYIDFGRTDVEDIARKIPETLCLTNHTQANMLIKWEQDDEETFRITPATAKIPATQTVLFDVTFNPNRKSSLFARELGGYVFAEQKEEYKEKLAFPMISSVRLIGHSFPTFSDTWTPRYEIPHIIRMPPCIPGSPVYTTFLIKKFGHLPLMYRFVSPPSSHFVVKPMMGMIHQDYQIVVVGMLPGNQDQHIYMERWEIYFNGNSRSECFIDFRGFAEHANVSFSNKDVVSFAPSFPGCQEVQQFSMRNITRHTIKYRFFNVSSELRIQNLDGEVYSNDIVIHEWKFCPMIIGDYEFEINSVLNVLQDEIPIGPDICVTLCAIGRCEFSFLVSAPEELNFGIQAYKATKELSFYVFNLSPVNIHYKMTCCHCNWPIENIECNVELHPSMGTVYAGQNKTISVSVTPSMPGYYELFIRYFVRIDSHTDALVRNQIPRNICKLRYLCVLPILKVKDLQCYGPYPDMSKAFLWRLMKISMFNKLLRDLKPGISETLYINFPPMILHESPVNIKLLLTNISAITASWNIKRVQLCSCRPIIKTQGLSFHYAEHDCLHRKICCLKPRVGNIKSREASWVTLELRYILLGNTAVKWDLDLGDDRHIFLIMEIESLTETEHKLYLPSGPHFKFQHIYFGNKDPIYQVCWVHNNTNNSIPFSINTTMRKIDESYCYEAFFCATPSGIVNAQSSVPILLRFHPRQFGIFKRELSLILGDEEKMLTLEAESSLPDKPETIGEHVPSNHDSKIDDIPVYFNTDCIDVPYIAMHSHVVKMFMIYNNLKHDVLAYEWKRRDISGIIYVEMHPRKGLLKPMTVQTFRVTISTKGYPCVIDVNIPCEFINTSQRRAYQRSIYKHRILSQELEGQFTITEKDISIPEPSIKIVKKPQSFYKTLTIRCSIYSPEDKFLKLNLMQELISAPPNEIFTEQNDKQMITFTNEDINLSSFILEGLLWDVVNSKLFKSLMQNILEDELNLIYSQFITNLHERRRLIRRSYISPPRALINRILEKMLFVIVHEEFALETIHLIHHTDIRHAGYLNIMSNMNRSTIKRETRLLYRDTEHYDTASKLTFSSKVSFAKT